MKNVFPTLLCVLISYLGVSQDVTVTQFNDASTAFIWPTDLQNAGDDRLFVVEKPGVIQILNPDGTANAVPFLDIQGIVNTPSSSFDEQGLLGLAFHPNYATNGFFYVNYIDNSANTQVSRFTVSADPNIADDTTEFPIIDFVQPFSNHNGGQIVFGPDGFLYIGNGDGGSGGDPGDRAQTLTNPMGKMMRIDVDNPGGGNNYGIPADNPFVSNPSALDEIWAYGLRNPWRFSFDSDTGELWTADVGQQNIEEINRVAATDAGINYGWRCYEGSQPFNTSGCPPMGDLTFPVAEYTHSGGNCSITGGYVYRGDIFTSLEGIYVFADVCSGMIGTVDQANNMINHGNFSEDWSTFGLDVSGEMYVASLDGDIYKIEGEILDVRGFKRGKLTVIPNPAKDTSRIIMENEAIHSVTITDLKGSVLFSEGGAPTKEKTLDVSSYSKGLYFVHVVGDSGNSIVKKLIKE